MRRLNDVKKVADFIISNFKSSEFRITQVQQNSIDLVVPYLPSNIVCLVSNDIRIGVFPYGDACVTISIYKL